MSNLKFVGLHAHSCAGSPFDATDYPQEHMDYARENEMDALALTDHGSMEGVAFQLLHQKKLKDKGINFKAIPGVEAYFIPSLKDWKISYDESKIKAKTVKLSDPLVPHIEDLEEVSEIKQEEKLSVENEEDTKSNKYKNPLLQRSHLVILPKNEEGLKGLYRMVSESNINGYYRYPRIDLEMIKKFGKGNFIGSSACIGSYFAKTIFDNQDPAQADWKLWQPNDYNFELIQKKLKEHLDSIVDAFGSKENFYLELQMNRLGAQHLVNMHLIELSKRESVKLIVTADSHYARPEKWRDREVYKLMGRFSQKQDFDVNSIPKTIDELKCELYPKNGYQIWKSYEDTAKEYDFYDDTLVKEAIERTYDIAHKQIDSFEIDSKIKLPAIKRLVDQDDLEKFYEELGKDIDEEIIAVKALAKLVFRNAKEKNVFDIPEYRERILKELKIIKSTNNAKYFLTYHKIVQLIEQVCLFGIGRGSAGASVVCWLLGITKADPVKYGILLDRFMSFKKVGASDIDSDVSNRDKAREIIANYFGNENVVAITNYNQLQLKSLIKNLAKLHDIPFQDINQYTNKIYEECKSEAKKQPGFDAAQWVLTADQAEENSETFRMVLEMYPQIKESLIGLFKQKASNSRHAGGVLITEDAVGNMPLIRSGGVLQTPWTEGLNFRQLEPFGFLKFDILGLSTLRTIEECIRLILLKETNKEPTFLEIKKWFDENLHPDVNDYSDIKVYKNVYWNRKFVSTFQFVNPQAQSFVSKVRPTKITDISDCTAIFRPGALCLSGDTHILTKYDVFSGKPDCKRTTIEKLYNDFKQNKNQNIVSYDETSKKLIKNKILDVFKSGMKDVYELKLQTCLIKEDKYRFLTTGNLKTTSMICTVKSTLEHKFLTADGWKALKDLKDGDYILSQKKNTYRDATGRKRPLTSGIEGQKNFQNIAFRKYKYQCIFCEWNDSSLDVNHLDGNRKINNSSENLCFLCPNHHRMFSEGKITCEQVLQRRRLYELILNDDIQCLRYVGKNYCGKEMTYDISMQSPHNNFIAGGLVVHNSVGADKIYLENRSNPENIVYKHPAVKEVLEKSYNTIIYQETIQMLVHKLTGMPLEDTDHIRKAFTKKDLSNKEKTEKEREVIREAFIKGCVEYSKMDENIAEEIWEQIVKFVAYSFNFSHSLLYSMNSYLCAYLLTYYEKEWVLAVLKTDPDLEESIKQIKSIGYNIKMPDINISTNDWVCDNDKNLYPSFTSIKGIGNAAVEEITSLRPFTDIYDLLYRKEIKQLKSGPKEKWVCRLSKFNKKSLEAMIKLNALDSLGCVGYSKLFENYAHMHRTVIENWDKIKTKPELLMELAQTVDKTDWTQKEKAAHQQELLGTYDKSLILGQDVLDFFKEQKIQSVGEISKFERRTWFAVDEVKTAKTKTDNVYYKLSISDLDSAKKMLNYFGEAPEGGLESGCIYMAPLHINENGFVNVKRFAQIEKIS